jgi:hypothetical protein
MIRTWKMLGYPAILTAALAAAPSLAEADDTAKQNSDTKKVTLEDINESLKSVQKKLEEYRLGANIMGEDLQSLKNKVAQLEKDVGLLRSRSNTSNYQPTAPPTPNSGAGHVRLVNTWPATVTILLNDRSFRVEPGQTIDVPDVPAGAFTYEVLEARPDNTVVHIREKQPRTLAAGETFTIHVHPH